MKSAVDEEMNAAKKAKTDIPEHTLFAFATAEEMKSAAAEYMKYEQRKENILEEKCHPASFREENKLEQKEENGFSSDVDDDACSDEFDSKMCTEGKQKMPTGNKNGKKKENKFI